MSRLLHLLHHLLPLWQIQAGRYDHHSVQNCRCSSSAHHCWDYYAHHRNSAVSGFGRSATPMASYAHSEDCYLLQLPFFFVEKVASWLKRDQSLSLGHRDQAICRAELAQRRTVLALSQFSCERKGLRVEGFSAGVSSTSKNPPSISSPRRALRESRLRSLL